MFRTSILHIIAVGVLESIAVGHPAASTLATVKVQVDVLPPELSFGCNHHMSASNKREHKPTGGHDTHHRACIAVIRSSDTKVATSGPQAFDTVLV
jgi:hypothetical protein